MNYGLVCRDSAGNVTFDSRRSNIFFHGRDSVTAYPSQDGQVIWTKAHATQFSSSALVYLDSEMTFADTTDARSSMAWLNVARSRTGGTLNWSGSLVYTGYSAGTRRERTFKIVRISRGELEWGSPTGYGLHITGDSNRLTLSDAFDGVTYLYRGKRYLTYLPPNFSDMMSLITANPYYDYNYYLDYNFDTGVYGWSDQWPLGVQPPPEPIPFVPLYGGSIDNAWAGNLGVAFVGAALLQEIEYSPVFRYRHFWRLYFRSNLAAYSTIPVRLFSPIDSEDYNTSSGLRISNSSGGRIFQSSNTRCLHLADAPLATIPVFSNGGYSVRPANYSTAATLAGGDYAYSVFWSPMAQALSYETQYMGWWTPILTRSGNTLITTWGLYNYAGDPWTKYFSGYSYPQYNLPNVLAPIIDNWYFP